LRALDFLHAQLLLTGLAGITINSCPQAMCLPGRVTWAIG
jgi:hypothetical protein